MTTDSKNMPATGAGRITDRWNDDEARGLSEQEQLRYRSNLLGSDLRITNYGGGNTSAKVPMLDPLTGESVDVLWVKGSGGDLGSATLDGFASLYLEKLRNLTSNYAGPEREDDIPPYFPHCTFNLNPRAASIDTPLHGFIDHRHIDHMHADAIIAIAAARHGERLTQDIFGGDLAWVPWQRPGFDLGLTVGRVARERPNSVGLILGGHGLMTWAANSRACYHTTLGTIQKAADWLHAHGKAEPFGPIVAPALSAADRRRLLEAVAPILRGLLSTLGPKVMHYVDSPGVLEFVGSARCETLARLGTTCPDHFLRTRVRPLFVPFAPGREEATDLVKRLPAEIDRYRAEYTAYYERCKRADSPAMRDPSPVIVLVPGLGLLAFQSDKQTARIAAEFYESTVRIVRWAEAVDEYVPILEQEAFDIEYWSLEEAKLRRLPPRKSLDGRVALVTGGAGGIGGATARRLAAEGASIVLLDIDEQALADARAALARSAGEDRVRAIQCDVTSEASVAGAFAHAIREYAGIDILVSNAGIASASPIEETSLELWDRNVAILATGYFLVSREAFRLMKAQGRGGSIVFIGSKNALVASPGAAAYSTAKAAALHLARSLAVEGAPIGIRANVVNPDAVIRGSRIWAGSWRAARAASNKIDDEQVEEFYRQRSLLKRSVFPEDVAEAVYFFASDASGKSTGNVLNVDAGNPASFTR
ncbi:MAG TPA: bifunctional rhamnulose-1-phosphate aldolase/short-chain dehydrogenase [Vicinamibacterales bacterium]|nr:bifunctional rhamnulose-1-phosphate aldolase/short-chain dehydrogenase [Vicinamibacterales bacterium]